MNYSSPDSLFSPRQRLSGLPCRELCVVTIATGEPAVREPRCWRDRHALTALGAVNRQLSPCCFPPSARSSSADNLLRPRFEQKSATPFPRPPVRPSGSFRGLPPRDVPGTELSQFKSATGVRFGRQASVRPPTPRKVYPNLNFKNVAPARRHYGTCVPPDDGDGPGC